MGYRPAETDGDGGELQRKPIRGDQCVRGICNIPGPETLLIFAARIHALKGLVSVGRIATVSVPDTGVWHHDHFLTTVLRGAKEFVKGDDGELAAVAG